MDLPKEYSSFGEADIVILPVPYAASNSYMKGTENAPEAIIEASSSVAYYDIETGAEVCKRGIYTESPVTEKKSPERMIQAVRKSVYSLIENKKFVVTLGGDHSTSIGSIQAHADLNNGLSVLHLGANADLRDEYKGSRFSTECSMARVKELCQIVQVGIRNIDQMEKPKMEKGSVVFAHEIHHKGNWIEKAVARLSKKIYITIDVNIFDTSLMPAAARSEPGGLFWDDVTALLKSVAAEKEIAGFDIFGLNPDRQSRPYSYIAAKLAYKLLSYKFAENKK